MDMKKLLCIALIVCSLFVTVSETASAFPPEVKTYSEKEAKKFLKNLNQEWAKKTSAFYVAKWDYEASMTTVNLAKRQALALEVAKFQKQQRREAVKYPREKFQDRDLRRQLSMYAQLGPPGLTDDKYMEFLNTYDHLAKAPRCNNIICDPDETVGADAELKQRIECWQQRRYGLTTTEKFNKLATLVHESAKLDNLTDFGKYLLRKYEQGDLQSKMQQLIQNVLPTYKEMVVYCRHRLRQRYGANLAPNGEPIPDHLTDAPICNTDPIPSKPLDFPGALRAKGFTVRKLFGLPDEFFRSLNMSAIPDAVWEKSYLEEPGNVSMNCNPLAQDFLDNKDYRIRMCGKVNEETLFEAAKLVTEVRYKMEMRHQPSIYRQTVNDALIEGVGGMVALSLVSPVFLRYQNLLAGDDSEEMDANLLYMIARNTLIPGVRSYVNDLWRIEALSNKIESSAYNCDWWKKRQELEGVEPPFNRSYRDFDPASNPRLLRGPLSTPFRNSFGMVLAFQLHRSLCLAAGLFDAEDPERLPLHRCNLLGQTVVSDTLRKMMQTGASEPWQDVLEQAIGKRELDSSAMEVYFTPLFKYLDDWNRRTGESIGWNPSHKGCGFRRWELNETDPSGAEAGYYSCLTGEDPEPPKPAPTTPPPTTPAPTSTVASSSSSPSEPDSAASSSPASAVPHESTDKSTSENSSVSITAA